MASEEILVVDDEPGVRDALEGILRDEGFAVTTVGSGEEGLDVLGAGRFDAVLLDVWLPGIDGLETLIRLRDRNVDSEVIMISGHGTIDTAVRATKLGAFDFVEKPLSLERTLLVLRNALRQRRLERRNRHLLAQLSRDTEILGVSAAAERVRTAVAAAAASESPVLICGERGTGRETVARRIHAGGARADGPFVDVPCAALVGEAAEKTLFGEESRPGRIEIAEGGTLFLDDVHGLDPAVQARLAARLDAGSRDAPNVRVLASTASDPSSIAAALRQVLDVIRVEVPPLRERREDIALLVERFMRDLSREYGRAEKSIDGDALASLKTHPWPGNVRELHNLVERLLLLAPGAIVRGADLPEALGGTSGPAADLYREFASLAEGVETFERYYIRRMLAEERGEPATAAYRLGLPESALRKRMKDLGISDAVT